MVDPRAIRTVWAAIGRAAAGLFVVGFGLGIAWLLAVSQGADEQIAESALLAAIACILAAVGFVFTLRIGVAALERTVATPGARYAWRTLRIALASVGTLWLVAIGSLAAAVPHFVRSWPVSPSEAGTVLFYALGGLVLLPLGFGLVFLAIVVAARGEAVDRQTA
ncbi:hypothetical protein [Halovivax sp.]|uniref:hypothetical protein n=1 Tax=Halovivax sp. TaxID=1935978 RepID=UPI0025BAB72D|nr:hypothetical protein [Halovivax sp.]